MRGRHEVQGQPYPRRIWFQTNQPHHKQYLFYLHSTAFTVPTHALAPSFPPLFCVRLLDLSQSFYVGDAAGRPTDFIDNATGMPSDVDRQFARNAQLEFKLPEELFGQ